MMRSMRRGKRECEIGVLYCLKKEETTLLGIKYMRRRMVLSYRKTMIAKGFTTTTLWGLTGRGSHSLQACSTPADRGRSGGDDASRTNREDEEEPELLHTTFVGSSSRLISSHPLLQYSGPFRTSSSLLCRRSAITIEMYLLLVRR